MPEKNLNGAENFSSENFNLWDLAGKIEDGNLAEKRILLAQSTCFDLNGNAISCDAANDAGAFDAQNFFENMKIKPLNLKLENTKNGFELFDYGKRITPEKTDFGWKISTKLEAGFFNTNTEKYGINPEKILLPDEKRMIYFSCFDGNMENLNFIIRTKNVEKSKVYKLTTDGTIDLIQIPNGENFLWIAVRYHQSSGLGLIFHFEITNYNPQKED